MFFENNTGAFSQRSDLAVECRELAEGKSGFDADGIESIDTEISGVKISETRIKTDSGAEKLGKPRGTYISIDTGKLWQYSGEDFEALCDICAGKLSEIIPQSGSCLLVCLGNRSITSDSQGPLCAEGFVVTRHIKDTSPDLFASLGLRETACIVPDVLGNTGIEAVNTVRGIVEKIKPDFVIAVDSLASRRTARIGTTLQMCDSGISPGSGVGNHRLPLSRETLGIPVISIGVPTVVDAATIGADVLEEYFRKSGQEIPETFRDSILGTVLKSQSFNYFVTPKNTDTISKCAARLISMSVNKALNPHIPYPDLRELAVSV